MIKKLFLELFFVWILFLFSSLTQAAYVDPRLNWKTIQTTHFNIHYYDQEVLMAEKLAPIAEKVHEQLSKKYQWQPWGRTEIVLVDSTDIANGFATVLPYNYILLFLTAPEADSFLNYYDDWLEDLFIHEYTHILHMDQYGGIATPFHWILGKIIAPNGLTPAWVREGIAVYQESKKGKGRAHNPYVDMVLRTDILNHQFLNIDEAANFKVEWPSNSAAYLYGGAFWTYLADTYGDEKIEEFIKRYGDSLWFFSLNNKARKTFDGKNFLTLWKEWKASLEKKYAEQKAKIEQEPLTPLEVLFKEKGNITSLTLAPDGETLAYIQNNLDGPAQIHLRTLQTGKDEILAKRQIGDRLNFSPDGKKIIFSAITNSKIYNFYKDLFELDIASKKITRLTQGQRLSFPSYHPSNGKILAVKTLTGSSELLLYDPRTKTSEVLTQSIPYVLYSYPHFSPDGQKIVATVWKEGKRNLYLLSADGKHSTQLTSGNSNKTDPSWTKEGHSILYTSDEDGVPNLYALHLGEDLLEMKGNITPTQITQKKITHVLTGLFYPQEGKENRYYSLHYTGRGFEVVRLTLSTFSPLSKITAIPSNKKIFQKGKRLTLSESIPSKTEPLKREAEGNLRKEYHLKNYNPFNKFFVPRYLIPGFYYGDGGLILNGITGSNDPLGWHFWSGDISYRTNLGFLGGDFQYTYNRLAVPFYVGFSDHAANYGDIFHLGKDYYEERRNVYGGIEARLGPKHKLNAYYTFEFRKDASDLPSSYSSQLNLGRYAGFGFTYRYNNTKTYPLSIGREEGPSLKINFEYLDEALGSSPENETKVLEADFRYYWKIPKTPRHFLAFRAAGGINWGDKLYQGVFRLGSALGESTLNPNNSRLYALRGLPSVTFSGDRALLFSAEYRLPLLRVDRGWGTAPFYLKDFHLAFFGDLGSVFDQAPHWDEFLLGVGAELRSDFVLGYGLPLSARLGYGVIVKGRKFLGSLQDPVTGSSLKNGTVLFQLGTSF
ncbi:MAG: PD40 domain-containing protein [Deltaproteobacteria bacterium]|nr:PD40 domain-containing protein [Deltaproteobacteria bacterium]